MFTYANLPPPPQRVLEASGSAQTSSNFNCGHQSVPATFLASDGDVQDHASQQASISQTHGSNHCRGGLPINDLNGGSGLGTVGGA
ncbi:unnamed protein product [Rhizoctonia solani]|uniref:Uncharacterized protein n=1 Tax=Rhizoctonia solani TaxID=456999 RepID=A0A8H3GT25_9AGAM|nr:unnamed protein product [Rhizoctonia solani]CAE6464726.1 unnamed protein product [Rhizoctonia solani]